MAAAARDCGDPAAALAAFCGVTCGVLGVAVGLGGSAAAACFAAVGFSGWPLGEMSASFPGNFADCSTRLEAAARFFRGSGSRHEATEGRCT
mmetsp:Transcript_38581/g.116628  ORF Transcript_38581/g.116628 Transcript_38581/m.116628 type:complete len:92 (-) Transcript_38581:314-589(-)